MLAIAKGAPWIRSDFTIFFLYSKVSLKEVYNLCFSKKFHESHSDWFVFSMAKFLSRGCLKFSFCCWWEICSGENFAISGDLAFGEWVAYLQKCNYLSFNEKGYFWEIFCLLKNHFNLFYPLRLALRFLILCFSHSKYGSTLLAYGGI